uniref:Uncharacterized protein n=1 Tax=Rhizophora mucronata TaxID=61149 RepID=A0A2P2MZR4_RHIMU
MVLKNFGLKEAFGPLLDFLLVAKIVKISHAT